jgi:hypothetical protein
MLPEESILRHLPARLDPTERIRLEATVFAADALSFAFSSIREITARHGSGISSIPRHERTALFVHAWTMVDQIHVLRQLLHAMRNGQMGPNQKKFYDTSEPALKMRNKMDHLKTNIRNRTSQRGKQGPLFGTLSYFLVEPHQMKQTDAGTVVEAGTIVSITSGSVQVGNRPTGRIPNPADQPIHPPVSQFILTAFDRNLVFDEVLEALQLTLNKSSEQAEASLRKQAEAESSRSGSTVVELMSTFPIANFVLMADVIFGDQSVE